jgi:hypothetical protein
MTAEGVQLFRSDLLRLSLISLANAAYLLPCGIEILIKHRSKYQHSKSNNYRHTMLIYVIHIQPNNSILRRRHHDR